MARVTGRINLRGYARQLDEACVAAAEAAADHILGVSQELVPLEEGPLQNSGRVVVSARGRRATIVYTTPYALIQEENEDFRHAPGRQAHYLGQPMVTEAEVAKQIMAAVLRRAAR